MIHMSCVIYDIHGDGYMSYEVSLTLFGLSLRMYDIHGETNHRCHIRGTMYVYEDLDRTK